MCQKQKRLARVFKSPRHSRPRNAIIARAGELDQIEAVPKWVCHVRNATIFTCLHFAIKRTSYRDQSRDSCVDIRHNKIQVNRRTVRSCGTPLYCRDPQSLAYQQEDKGGNSLPRARSTLGLTGASKSSRDHDNKSQFPESLRSPQHKHVEEP